MSPGYSKLRRGPLQKDLSIIGVRRNHRCMKRMKGTSIFVGTLGQYPFLWKHFVTKKLLISMGEFLLHNEVGKERRSNDLILLQYTLTPLVEKHYYFLFLLFGCQTSLTSSVLPNYYSNFVIHFRLDWRFN